MTLEKFKKQLALVVLNQEQWLGHGHRGQHNFDECGGTIGSSEQDDWQLADRLGGITASHARVEFHDGHFCLCDVSGQSYINGMTTPIGRSRRVCLQQGDELGMGTLRVRVYLDVATERSELLPDTADEQLNAWLASEQYDNPKEAEMSHMADPLLALQGDSPDLSPSPIEPDRHMPKTLVTPSAITFAAKRRYHEVEDMPHSIEPLAPLTKRPEETVAAIPMLKGIGLLPLGKEAAHSDAMLEEMGQTLRAAVEGLLELQIKHAALADKQLRPIEDNPLRMGLDYEATVAMLFSEPKNPVHLTAPEAVAESLNILRIHHLANQQAIAAALSSTVRAFSPEALLSRFARYRRAEPEQSCDDAWAWSMYQHFYDELTSVRQQGFEKLFHQVYAQAYDHSVRQQQEGI